MEKFNQLLHNMNLHDVMTPVDPLDTKMWITAGMDPYKGQQNFDPVDAMLVAMAMDYDHYKKRITYEMQRLKVPKYFSGKLSRREKLKKYGRIGMRNLKQAKEVRFAVNTAKYATYYNQIATPL